MSIGHQRGPRSPTVSWKQTHPSPRSSLKRDSEPDTYLSPHKKEIPVLKKKAKTTSLIQPNSIFSSRRKEVFLKNGQNVALEDSVDEEETNAKLKQLLDKTLNESWKRELFRRFLEQTHSDQVLELYSAIRNFYVTTSALDNVPVPNSKKRVIDSAIYICNRFESSCPSQLRDVIISITERLIYSSLAGNKIPPLPYTTSFDKTDADSDTDGQSTNEDYFLFDTEDGQYDVNPLSMDEMVTFNCDDPWLYKSKYFSNKIFLLIR